ncbi:hypothetical protein O6H91_11G037300 [Diphasiastrum complanatum]|uniref:Uncharacterized protein n=3 Tax=Diphasiastrum complanatum TaxID=34168 RepID=A0ACC2C825_DIPCM|nr:hypothetical protein O6H91_11G037300 [Diphasiastrum complanatum]KAJ7538183.1 hypothetical protein O6H91_11G037300 [Diphasiastrum complanatum]KAJ7538184.1 hypothetical protein O6H91_11G037300 [Diphasiastrum complanatum]
MDYPLSHCLSTLGFSCTGGFPAATLVFRPKRSFLLSSQRGHLLITLNLPRCLNRLHGQSVELEPKKVVVVGGGWAGFGAAHALTKAGCSVTLLDAAASVGGLSTGFRTAQGRPVEAGVKGFWWQYHNIFQLVKELSIPSPFTDWTKSSFYSPEGIDVEAPIFSSLPRLPTPLGSFLYTTPLFRKLPIFDRLTALPLVQALIEFDTDMEIYNHYDQMTARELFRKAGVSKQLYHEFLEPVLFITLFAPAEQLSAAATLGALYYYVLAHQPDFDVCWCKGSIVDVIFKPWVKSIEHLGGRVLGGRRVQDVIMSSDATSVTSVIAANPLGEMEIFEADAVIFAVGVEALKKIIVSSNALSGRQEFAAATNIGTIDVLASRIWFDCRVPLRNPSNVLSGFEAGSGGTLFDLNALQTEFAQETGSVVEVDIFHANSLIPLKDKAIVQRILEKYLQRCDARYKNAKVVDYSVLRFKNAVTLFGPNCHQYMPTTSTSFHNVFMAGDWLQQGPGSHGARGLSQEKAYVTGLQAANAVSEKLGISFRAKILNVEPDEIHIAAAKYVRKYLWNESHRWNRQLFL